MNLLEQKGLLTKMNCGANLSYLLNEDVFLPTEYKVLQSQNNSCFVKCMKMSYNGAMQLYYLTKEYKSLQVMAGGLDTDGFLTVVSNLFGDVVDVKNNGFLSCGKLDLSFEHIYVDPATYKVSLVYLPVNERLYNGDSAVENEIRTGLVKLIGNIPTLSGGRISRLTEELSDGTLSLEELWNRLKGGYNTVRSGRTQSVSESQGENAGVLCLRSVNTPETIVLEVQKPRYMIGKNAAAVDGVISCNKAISRIHCCIEKLGAEYQITDMGSANGTFVNGDRVLPNQSRKIQPGDRVRLADSEFRVTL